MEDNLRLSGYKISEFTDMVLLETKEERKHNTYEIYKHAVKKFFKIMGDSDIEKIRVRDIDRYIFAMKKQGLSSSTISLYLAPIRLAFNEAIRQEIIDKNPVNFAKKPTVRNKKKKPFTLLQMHYLLNNAKGELKTFLYFAFFTGARPNEILGLNWEDINDGSVYIQRTIIGRNLSNSPKNGKCRKLAMMKPLKDFIKTRERGRNLQKVVSLTYSSASREFKKLIKLAGYEKTSLHVTRHTFTSLLLQARESPSLVQYFLGHSSLNMINKVYAHYIEDEHDVTRIEKILSM